MFQIQMNLLVWLILVSSVYSDPAPEARRSRQTSRSSRNNRRELSDEDILKALTILLEEAEGDVSNQRREGKQTDGGRRERKGRQGFEGVLGQCETTGFEVRTREECNEVNEIKCEKVNVTKFRNTIVEKCQTLFDQKCNVTYNDVPSPKCFPKQRKKYGNFTYMLSFLIFQFQVRNGIQNCRGQSVQRRMQG